MTDKSDTLTSVCDALAVGALDVAASTLKHGYPFVATAITSRRYGPIESTRVFVRDGFVDRYGGGRLVFPPVLRVLSTVLPVEFPYHANWKTNTTHPAYWELCATVDHVVPVSRGGGDDDSNWVTTSMVRNSAKLNYSLEELGWTLKPRGDLRAWDGLLGWFLRYVAAHGELSRAAWLKPWHRAAASAVRSI